MLMSTQMIVEKDSAVLGYPDEVPMAMKADHHTICKYPSREDVNYINLRNLLKTMVDKFRRKGTCCPRAAETHDHPKTHTLLESLSSKVVH